MCEDMNEMLRRWHGILSHGGRGYRWGWGTPGESRLTHGRGYKGIYSLGYRGGDRKREQNVNTGRGGFNEYNEYIVDQTPGEAHPFRG